jgi:hypothetical protein
MSERKPQNFANHGRYDPWFHFFLLPLTGLTFFACVYLLIRHPHSLVHHVLVVITLIVLMAVVKLRNYSLRVQDRVIRLEERVRLAALLPEALRARIPELTERQLIALRFASDDEIVALVEKTLNENLAPAEIKKRIQSWRADYFRV